MSRNYSLLCNIANLLRRNLLSNNTADFARPDEFHADFRGDTRLFHNGDATKWKGRAGRDL